jgi:hypothetical protein
LVNVFAAPSEHDHWHIRYLAYRFQHFEAVHTRHADVQQDDVRLFVEEAIQADLAVGRG